MSEGASRDDPHGYKRLYTTLGSIRDQLAAAGLRTEAERVAHAISFAHGLSATEWLIESETALRDVEAAQARMPEPLLHQVLELRREVEEGLRRAGW